MPTERGLQLRRQRGSRARRRGWRIVEADIWDRDYLDLSGPATITDNGRGEIAFGALQAGLDIEYSRSSVGFNLARLRRNG
jgi:hypothetical protein